MIRKSASDSITGQIGAEMREIKVYEVPEGLKKLRAPEKIAWNQWTTHKDGWKASELRELHTLVKLETRYNAILVEQEKLPYCIENASGVEINHPIHVQVDACLKMIQTQIRMMGLNAVMHAARDNGKEGAALAPVQASRGKRPLLAGVK
jgi:hypothetical protein